MCSATPGGQARFYSGILTNLSVALYLRDSLEIVYVTSNNQLMSFWYKMRANMQLYIMHYVFIGLLLRCQFSPRSPIFHTPPLFHGMIPLEQIGVFCHSVANTIAEASEAYCRIIIFKKSNYTRSRDFS